MSAEPDNARILRPTKRLFQALALAQKNIGALHKDGSGPRGTYVTIDSAVAASKEALASAGLLLVQTGAHFIAGPFEGAKSEKGAAGEPAMVPCLKREFFLCHLESGEQLPLDQTWPIHAHRGRAIDLAAASTDSLALTYLLRGLLLFPRGEEHIDTREGPEEPVEAPEEERKPMPRRDAGVFPRPPRAESKPRPPRPGEAEDYTAEQLRGMGWHAEAPSADDLESFGDDDLPRQALRDLHDEAKRLVGGPHAKQFWRELGVELEPGTVINGKTARRFAAIVADDAGAGKDEHK